MTHSTVWRRKGLVMTPPVGHAWCDSCAGVPTCLPIGERLWRIWFGARDAQGRAGILCADLDPGAQMQVLALRAVPGLQHGGAGAFDSAGIWPASVLQVDGRILLWYTGMRLGGSTPYELAIGLATSDDGGITFRKQQDEPVLRGRAGELAFVTTPCVRHAGTGFEMWYSQGTTWRDTGGNGGKPDPRYDLRCATSPDGVCWDVRQAPLIALDDTPWAALTRPWVDGTGDDATLWFGARGEADFRAPSADAYRLFQVPLRQNRVRLDEVAEVVFTPAPMAGD